MPPTTFNNYKTLHPNAKLITSNFNNLSAALNALVNKPIWICDSEIRTPLMEVVDLSTDKALKEFRAGPAMLDNDVRWRAPEETLRWSCSLWKESYNSVIRCNVNVLVFAITELMFTDFETLHRLSQVHGITYSVELINTQMLLLLAFVQ